MHTLQVREPVDRSNQDVLEIVNNFQHTWKKPKVIPDSQHLAFLYFVVYWQIAFSRFNCFLFFDFSIIF